MLWKKNVILIHILDEKAHFSDIFSESLSLPDLSE